MRSSLFGLREARGYAPPRLAFLTRQPFAHRGLHGHGIVENSQASFRAAIAEGHGIELDVQPAVDGTPFVFHDATLDRLTKERGRVAERQPDELRRIALAETDETLATLARTLTLVAGRTPVLVEIKSEAPLREALCRAVARVLQGYRGEAAIMSFDPRVPGWFAANAPNVVRGLVLTEHGRGGLRGRIERIVSLWRARPEFLAYDVRDLPARAARAARERGLPVLTWTVRSVEDHLRAARFADQPIYERLA